MSTKTSPRDTIAKTRYAAGTSRGARSVTTLLAQVEDLARGQRIKTLREKLHLTQPAAVDLIEAVARELPREHPLHPEQLGKAPVTLRGYQAWEKGGGIRWENAKLLSQVLSVEPDWLLNGDRGETPDPFVGDGSVQEQLAEISRQLADARSERERIEGLLTRQSEILERIEQATAKNDDSTQRLDQAAQESRRLLRELESAAQSLAATQPRTGGSDSPPASN